MAAVLLMLALLACAVVPAAGQSPGAGTGSQESAAVVPAPVGGNSGLPATAAGPAAAAVTIPAPAGGSGSSGQAAGSSTAGTSTVVLPVHETGQASWYGDPFHGRRTASGEIFDKNQFTAAHKTLPFGTVVVVRNLENSLTVTVRINDRGPFVAGRIIDLSQAAGAKIGLDHSGVARVSLHILARSPAETNPPQKRIQLGSYGQSANASAARERAAAAGLDAVLEAAGSLTRVVVYVSPEKMAETLAALRQAGFSDPLVSDVKP